MDSIKNISVCICVTLAVASILSYLAPVSTSGKLYRSLVKIFILFSFILPFHNADFSDLLFDFNTEEKFEIYSNKYQTNEANQIIDKCINNLLKSNNINGAIVDVYSTINKNNEIEVSNINVIVADEYNCEEIEDLIFNNLSLNVDVLHIGQ